MPNIAAQCDWTESVNTENFGKDFHLSHGRTLLQVEELHLRQRVSE